VVTCTIKNGHCVRMIRVLSGSVRELD